MTSYTKGDKVWILGNEKGTIVGTNILCTEGLHAVKKASGEIVGYTDDQLEKMD